MARNDFTKFRWIFNVAFIELNTLHFSHESPRTCRERKFNPQVTLYNWPLTLTNLFPVFNAPFERREYFQLLGVYNFGEDPQLPPPDWVPAAIWVDLDGMWGAIIQAAAPAVPNSRIATPIEPWPPVAQ